MTSEPHHVSLPRAVSLGAERLLGVTHQALDHGFVRLVDYMGNDAAVVQAARVSYGAGTKTPSDDRGLIRYLMRHQHTTPFEMCLAGDVDIPTFPCKGAAVKAYTMRQIVDAFEQGGRKNSWVKLLKIRTVNPNTGIVTATRIKRAWKTGSKMVYEVVTAAPFRRVLKVTDNHPILTPTGFRDIQSGLTVGDAVMLNGRTALALEVVEEMRRRRDDDQSIDNVAAALGVSPSVVFKYAPGRASRMMGFEKKPANDLIDPRARARRVKALYECEAQGCERPARHRHHIDENPHNNAEANLAGLCETHHKHAHHLSRLEKCFPHPIESIRQIGVEDVYDLEVEDDNHTFVAGGIVVHNCEIKLHVKLPIFVARQWIRHRTASVNEMSARYSILDNEFYIPELDQIQPQSQNNKQGRAGAFDEGITSNIQGRLANISKYSYDRYEALLGDGLARETARMVLPTNIYTQWYWKVNLHNLFRFLKLRADPHAQYEIRVYADAIGKIVEAWVPDAYQAFLDYQQNAVTFSALEMEILRGIAAKVLRDDGLVSDDLVPPNTSLSKRETQELIAKLRG